MLLKDRIAIVSGIGPGMGRDVSLAFAREGADLVLAARGADKLEAVAAEVRAGGRRALCVPTDIAEVDDCRRLADAAQAEFGRIDILVNNAFKGGLEPPMADAEVDEWRKIFDVNVFGSLQLTQAVIPHMRRGGGGSIVFINSMSMRVIEPNFGGYAASKGALMIAAQTLAKELGTRRHPRQLGRARLHLGPGAGGVLQDAGAAAGDDARRGVRRDRIAHRAQPHPHLGGDRRRGGLLRLRPVARHHRPGTRRQRRTLLPLTG